VSDSVHAPIGLLTGKVAVITGAGSGIGRGCAELFAREGAKILAVDFSGEQESVAARIGPDAIPHHADVSVEDEIEGMYRRALEAFGRVDAVLNVAATLASRKGEVTADEYEAMTATNMRGVLFSMKHAVRVMVPTGGGSIVNFSTVGSLATEQMAPVAYSAAKAAVNSMTKSFAVLHGPQGIRANVLAPGIATTERNSKASPEVLRDMCSKAALGRASTVDEQAHVAAFLASDLSSFVTGTIIPVDGGWSARLA
jgi:NAD(P)-dependent dehydrogenase (short-subunit alcohol dehydrogenase family)